jgi:hypothetical protein
MNRVAMNRVAAKVAYKPVGLLLGLAASALAAAAFRGVWKQIGGSEHPPDARDPSNDWVEVVLAAALQGAIFAGVKAAVDRAGAAGVGRATGEWPRRESPRVRPPTGVQLNGSGRRG